MKTFSRRPVKRKLHGKASTHYYTRETCTVTGQRRWRNTGKTALEAAREQVRAWERAEALGQAEQDNARFADAVERWLELKRSTMTDRGHLTYTGYGARWCEYIPEKARVRDVTPELVERYFVHRGANGVSASTRNKERTVLKAFFRWAHDHRLTNDRDPVRTVKKFKEEQRAIRALTDREKEKLLRACTEKYKAAAKGVRNAGARVGRKKTGDKREWKQTYTPPAWLAPLVRLGLATGLRLGNLAALTWHEVDFRRRRLVIPAKKMKARRDLVLPLDDDTLTLLEELHESATSVRVLELPDHRAIARAFEGAVKRAEIGATRFHDLRATWISDLGRSGVSLEVAARLAGHADVTTTARFYRDIDEDELRQAMERRAAAAREKAAQRKEASHGK